ncbi:hypothetical protein WJX81_001991 [Elliptochloris bilobata]|uniref:Uncharacterized protein n=1 Tax=Elliptochloris bilobata TaxID=381761 RepID=A0AAW1RQZ1_9CHLO
MGEAWSEVATDDSGALKVGSQRQGKRLACKQAPGETLEVAPLPLARVLDREGASGKGLLGDAEDRGNPLPAFTLAGGCSLNFRTSFGRVSLVPMFLDEGQLRTAWAIAAGLRRHSWFQERDNERRARRAAWSWSLQIRALRARDGAAKGHDVGGALLAAAGAAVSLGTRLGDGCAALWDRVLAATPGGQRKHNLPAGEQGQDLLAVFSHTFVRSEGEGRGLAPMRGAPADLTTLRSWPKRPGISPILGASHELLPKGANWRHAALVVPEATMEEIKEWATAPVSLPDGLDSMPDIGAASRVLIELDFPKVPSNSVDHVH